MSRGTIPTRAVAVARQPQFAMPTLSIARDERQGAVARAENVFDDRRSLCPSGGRFDHDPTLIVAAIRVTHG